MTATIGMKARPVSIAEQPRPMRVVGEEEAHAASAVPKPTSLRTGLETELIGAEKGAAIGSLRRDDGDKGGLGLGRPVTGHFVNSGRPRRSDAARRQTISAQTRDPGLSRLVKSLSPGVHPPAAGSSTIEAGTIRGEGR
ncbi:hypothetical protein ACFYO2_04400 [Streptomyces sp. NPDC006602]|uniref:hypothetical protein n=1 Tax=Streptomyces sp. NPDC006602 TaxID=3364751 RepID=UPI0036C66000